MSALVRITTGIMPQHSRVGMSRAMAQFGEAPEGFSFLGGGNGWAIVSYISQLCLFC